jgi:predicted nucleic acid-binding protein
MLLVDTSVWVDFFKVPTSPFAQFLDEALGNDEVVVGDLILVEILQGLRDGTQLKLVERYILPFKKVTLCGPEIAPKAAANFRALRRSGLTVRGTIDVIIATWCIENGVSLLHNDRDFSAMERVLGLACYRRLAS